MKTLIKKTLATTLAAIFLLAAIPASAIPNDSIKHDTNSKALELTALELEEIMFLIDEGITELSEDSITYEIYNESDELVMTRTVKRGSHINDRRFVKLKAQSDFFMEIGNTSIYRLNKK